MEYSGVDVLALKSEAEQSTWVFDVDQEWRRDEDVGATDGEGEEVS